MDLRMWMLDVAREQSPTLDHLYQFASLTQESGYNALGLYFEHRFAYPSTPWSHGKGCTTPEMIRSLRSEFPSLPIIPFVNLLGHFEGMIYTEEGKRYREDLFTGMQACPSKPEFVALCEKLIDDTLAIFDSEIVHIGGDETWQLASCPVCKANVEKWGKDRADGDGKAQLYGQHFGPLAARVLKAGRRPAVWGDMFADHPGALECLPKETLIFDWKYFTGVAESAKKFVDAGFEVVGCPAIHTYNATWMHVPQSEKNVREVAADVRAMGLHGVCVTTWECGLMGAYDTLLPAIKASGAILNGDSSGSHEVRTLDQIQAAIQSSEAEGAESIPGVLQTLDPRALSNGSFLEAYKAVSSSHGEWAQLMGEELQSAGGTFAFGGIRSSLKVRLLLNANPFLAWLHHADELSGEVGDKALAIIDRAYQAAPGEAEKGICLFARSAIEFVRIAEQARQEYAAGRAEAAVAKLAVTRQLFDDLAGVAKRTNQRIGGSMADIERCRIAKEHVERVMQRIRQYGDGSLGYLPAFEHLTHHKFVPHDQAAWWLINRWANQ